MITDAIQSVLTPIVNAYSPIIESDVLPAGVFAVHHEDVIETLRDKEGIYGFVYSVLVTVVGDSQELMDPIIDTIILTFEIIKDLSITGTLIDDVELKTTLGITWNDEKKKYYDELTFLFTTQNR